ncbi:MAG: type I-G CRISPR-associated helicase/endonuclease Cas3g [Acidimicrobiia bacterium]
MADNPIVTEAFQELVGRSTGGSQPYPYQTRLAVEGLPEILAVPTGTGKTLAVVLSWLFRRRIHPDPQVKATTPHWLVYVLPMRVLVEQVMGEVSNWLSRLGLHAEVNLHRVMGGEGRLEVDWRLAPDRDAIFVGTLDMVTSRQLNRGYGEGRFIWPIDFGLFNNGCHFVYDEVQLMGPALPTSRQLHGLRNSIGTALPCSATWMSATLDRSRLETVDATDIASIVELSDEDEESALAKRLEARRRIEHLNVEGRYELAVAQGLAERHRPGTLSLAILNTVDRASEVHRRLTGTGDFETVLLHSRFRPTDRHHQVQQALAPVDPDGPGRIVISTQVVEAGVDISADLLFSEAAPWPSMVQRAGRCNRDGLAPEALLLWTEPQATPPYENADVQAAGEALAELEGAEVTSLELAGRDVAVTEEILPVLRRRDLLDLFDTLPDLAGNDVDVSRFIREADDLDAEVAWRVVADPSQIKDIPHARERCPVPVSALRKFLKTTDRTIAWRFDHLAERWRPCRKADVRPGLVVIIEAAAGGYTPQEGWNTKSRNAVEPVKVRDPVSYDLSEGVGHDPLSFETGRWVTLEQHLADVEAAVRDITERIGHNGCTSDQLEAAAVAGRFHDLGKAHRTFQDALLATASDVERPALERRGPWAKSAKGRGGRYDRRYFRHELASALALLDAGSNALEDIAERDLVCYLVASHHGRVRLGFRPLPDEQPLPDGTIVALGVHDGELLPQVSVPGGAVPASTMDLSVMAIGASDDGPSWAARMLSLRDRPDLGPFRLGFLEAIVRLADWHVSASYQEVADA